MFCLPPHRLPRIPAALLRKALLLPLALLLAFSATAQTDSTFTGISQKRLKIVGLSFGATYATSLVALNQAWYKETAQPGFHFFNDNHEWKQLDKVGHFWTAFHESRAGVDVLRWAGAKEKKAIWYGGMLGIILQTPIEIFDGFQPEYGASVGDLVANTAGSAGVIAQELAWGELRIMPKFSFHTTRYAALRPNTLGSSLPEQLLKDYNGQTYWLVVDVAKFLPKDSKYPKWLNISAGYGASSMVFNDPDMNRQLLGHHAYRQYFLSPDLNLMAFKGRNKFLNTLLYIGSIFHLPAPALEYNDRKGLVFHPLYF